MTIIVGCWRIAKRCEESTSVRKIVVFTVSYGYTFRRHLMTWITKNFGKKMRSLFVVENPADLLRQLLLKYRNGDSRDRKLHGRLS